MTAVVVQANVMPVSRGSVPIAADAPTHSRRARLPPQISRRRSRGSSSSRMRAVPARHTTPDPLRTLTRTC